jgi:hypothetical protein
VPSRRVSRRRPWKGRGILERVLRNLPAYGARNVERVAAGTGEALPGPMVCGCCCRSVPSYNRSERGRGAGAGRESEAAVVPLEPTGQQNPR